MKLSEVRHSTSNSQGFFRGLSTVPKLAPNSQPQVSFHKFTTASHRVVVLRVPWVLQMSQLLCYTWKKKLEQFM